MSQLSTISHLWWRPGFLSNWELGKSYELYCFGKMVHNCITEFPWECGKLVTKLSAIEWSTWEQAASGMNWRLGGPPPWSGWFQRASWIQVSISQAMGSTTCEDGKWNGWRRAPIDLVGSWGVLLIECMQGSCGPSRPQMVVRYPPASASTPSQSVSLPRAPYCLHHNYFQQTTATVRRTHRSGVCSQVHVAVKVFLLRQYLKRRLLPQTADTDQDGLEQVL